MGLRPGQHLVLVDCGTSFLAYPMIPRENKNENSSIYRCNQDLSFTLDSTNDDKDFLENLIIGNHHQASLCAFEVDASPRCMCWLDESIKCSQSPHASTVVPNPGRAACISESMFLITKTCSSPCQDCSEMKGGVGGLVYYDACMLLPRSA